MARKLLNVCAVLALLAGSWGGVLAASACPHVGCRMRAAADTGHPAHARHTHGRDEHTTALHTVQQTTATDPAQSNPRGGPPPRPKEHTAHASAHCGMHAPESSSESQAHERSSEEPSGHEPSAPEASRREPSLQEQPGHEQPRLSSEPSQGFASDGGEATCTHCLRRPEAPPAQSFGPEPEHVRKVEKLSAPRAAERVSAPAPVFVREIRPSQQSPPATPSRHLLLGVFRI